MWAVALTMFIGVGAPDPPAANSNDPIPEAKGYVPTGVVIDFAGLPTDDDAHLLFRFEFDGREPYDCKVTTGLPFTPAELRDRLQWVFKQSRWETRRIGETRLEILSGWEKGKDGTEARFKVTDITITSKNVPKEKLPKVIRPKNKA
ncbi:MAG: hypothetical protein K2X82_28210 [Gemmataceae bacterium]|nr:hypothetical protein [Gemmataceae bacterium]